jgi:hypothetical protein
MPVICVEKRFLSGRLRLLSVLPWERPKFVPVRRLFNSARYSGDGSPVVLDDILTVSQVVAEGLNILDHLLRCSFRSYVQELQSLGVRSSSGIWGILGLGVIHTVKHISARLSRSFSGQAQSLPSGVRSSIHCLHEPPRSDTSNQQGNRDATPDAPIPGVFEKLRSDLISILNGKAIGSTLCQNIPLV